MTQLVCLNCNRADSQAPLLKVVFNGEEKYLCPRCFPILVHKPHQLAEKLPGLDITPPAPHSH